MAKLALKANPTFKAKVGIPVAGGESIDVEFTFKHRTREVLDAFVSSNGERTDSETFLAMVEGWDLDESFTAETANVLLENYIGASFAAFRVYIEELTKSKAKN